MSWIKGSEAARRFRLLLAVAGWDSTRDLCSASGFSTTTISRLLNGEEIADKTVAKIAAALKTLPTEVREIARIARAERGAA